MKQWLILLYLMFFCAAWASLYADTPPAPQSLPGMTGANLSPGAQADADQDVMTDIIDIKANEAIGFDDRIVYIVLAVIGALVLIALIIYLIDRYIKKRRKPHGEVEITVPAEARALQDLESLESNGFDDARTFYFTLTAIVKTYMDGRFGLGAPEMTTEELIPKINELSLDKTLASDVKELLKRSDPVKFAGTGEKRDQMVQDVTFVKIFVTKTTPDEQENDPSGPE